MVADDFVRVLVVDDEPQIREISKEFLEEFKHLKVETASSASEARAAHEKKNFDAIVSDYQMPKEDGIALLKSIRAKGDRTPFILFTGKGREDVVIEALNNGADSYIQKGGQPLSLYTELEHRILVAVGKRKAESNAEQRNQELPWANQELGTADVELRAQVDEIKASNDAMAEKEEELRLSEERYRDLFKNMPNGAAVHEMIGDIFDVPCDYRFLEVNHAFERMTGLKRNAVVGRTVVEVLHHVEPFWIERYGRVVRTGIPEQFEDYSMALDRHYLVSVYRNAPRQFTTIISDVTARVRMEKALRVSSAKYQTLLHTLPVGVTISDDEGRIIESNKEADRLLGLSEEEQKRRSIAGEEWNIVRSDGTPMPTEEFASVRALAEGRTIPNVEMGLVQGKRIIWIDVTAAPVPLEGYGVAIAYADVSKRKANERNLKERMKELQAFYRLADLVEQKDLSLEDLYEKLTSSLPDSLQYPEIACARIVVNEHEHRTDNYRETGWRISAPIKMHGLDAGFIEVGYLEERLGFDNGAILEEEKRLIVAIAERVGRIIERKHMEDELRSSQRTLADIIDFLPDATFAIDLEGRVIAWNQAIEQMTGVKKEEMVGQADHAFSIPLFGERRNMLLDLLTVDDETISAKHSDVTRDGNTLHQETLCSALNGGSGAYVWAKAVSLFDYEGRRIGAIESIRDITENKRAQNYRDLSREILQILTRPGTFQESLHHVLSMMKGSTGVDAVGLRLQKGDDFPYFTQEGFSQDFLLKESSLRSRGSDDRVHEDEWGRPSLDCMCGLVISGRTDPSDPLFTPGGSAWTNDAFPFIELSAEKDRRTHPRNECMRRGYASIAWIPIRAGGHIIGLVQLNDRRKGRFTREAVEFLEVIAENIGGAFLREQAEAEVQRLNSELQTIFDNTPAMIWYKDTNNKFIRVNQAAAASFGLAADHIEGHSANELFPQDAEGYYRDDMEVISQGRPKLGIEEKFNTSGGETRWVRTDKIPLRDDEGEVIGILVISQDITEQRRAQETLLQSESKFRDIFNNANDAIHLNEMSPDHTPGAIIDVNDVGCRMLGYSREELLRMSPADLTGEFHQPSLEEVMRLLRQDGMAKFETEHRRRDGSIFPVEINAHLVEMMGRPTVLAVVRDITERKRTQERMLQISDRLSLATRAGGVGIWDFDVVNNKLTWDSQMFKLYGIQEERFGGAYEAWKAGLFPEDAQRGDEEIQMALRGEKEFDSEFRVLWPDGTVRQIRALAQVQRDASGRPLRMVGTNWDITERKRVEEAQRQSEETLRLVVSSAPFPLLIADRDGTYIIDANEQAVEAFGLDMGRGQMLVDIFARAAELEALINDANGLGAVDGVEVGIRGKGGEPRWVMISLKTMTYQGEERLLLATYDITERRRMEGALQQANTKLGILNSITRHDIINQMLALTGFLELCKLREKDPTIMRYLAKMVEASDNVQKQVAFTKEYQDIGVKAPAWASPGGQMAKAFAMLHPKGVTLEDSTGGMEILADPLAEKVPYNLIDNSMRHGEHVAHIKISVQQRGESLLIVYEDDGVGISAEDKKRLFEKGFGKNTGFGLFLIREILAITGITITETGKAGEGVRFEMLVPPGGWRPSAQ